MALEECVNTMYVPHYTTCLLEALYNRELQKVVTYYVEGYGFENAYFGEAADVDPGYGTYVNHSCHGTNNLGSLKTSEQDKFAVGLILDAGDDFGYNPFMDRNIRAVGCSDDIFNQDLAAGSEVFSNYVTYFPREGWKAYIDELRMECNGGLGLVMRHEMGGGHTKLDTEYYPS
jgi:hypothetical protein